MHIQFDNDDDFYSKKKKKINMFDRRCVSKFLDDF